MSSFLSSFESLLLKGLAYHTFFDVARTRTFAFISLAGLLVSSYTLSSRHMIRAIS